jgi:hypothetical protein
MRYTIQVTSKTKPLQIEGFTEDERIYYFRARNGWWYLSVVWPSVDDQNRIIPAKPLAEGHYQGTEGITKQHDFRLSHAYSILKQYIGQAPSGTVNPDLGIAEYLGPEPARAKRTQVIKGDKVVEIDVEKL